MKKLKNFAVLLLCTAIMTIMLTGCPNVADILGGSKSYSITITSGIENGTITPNKITVPANETVVLTAAPSDGYQLTSVSATVGNNAITVSGTGNTRTFTMPSGNVTVDATFTAVDYAVNVSESISHGSVSADKTTAHYGETVTLTAEPDNGYQFYAWTVTDADGTAVTVTEGSFTMPMSAVTVSATFTPINSTISITNGIATVNGLRAISADAGTTVTITATPPTGKQFSNWTTTTSGLAFADSTSSSTTFFMPDSSVNITANCTDINYTISQTASFLHGTVTYNPTATYNSRVTLTITPDAGYNLSSLTITKASGGTIYTSGSANTRTFSMPAENVTVSATFNPQRFTVTKAQTTNGSININGQTNNNQSVLCDATIRVTTIPSEGYQLGSVTVSNGSTYLPVTGSGNEWTFTMPAGNATVNATFNPINYTVNNSGSFAHGSITASKTSNAHIGDQITLTASPDTGYRLDSISARVNGSSITLTSVSGNSNQKKFTMPAGNVLITASFVLEDYRIRKAGMSNGTVSFSNSTAHYNDTVTITIAPNNSFLLDTISATANGTPITLNGSGTANGSTRTFTMPAEEVTINATFVRTHLGTKDKPTAVGDIVFNDGTATPYSAGMTLTEQQKQAAIAIIIADETPDGYVLGLGLKQDTKALCSESASIYGRSDVLNDQDGSYYQYMIRHLPDYNEANYPAIWWAHHYRGSGNLASDNNYNWFIPSKVELEDVYRQKSTIDAINNLLGSTYADPLKTDKGYWSSSQQTTEGSDMDHHAFILKLANGSWVSNLKTANQNVIAVRKFDF